MAPKSDMQVYLICQIQICRSLSTLHVSMISFLLGMDSIAEEYLSTCNLYSASCHFESGVDESNYVLFTVVL